MQPRRHFLPVTPPGHQNPIIQTSQPLPQTLGSYFSPLIWQWVIQYATRYRYWMRSATFAYGTLLCLLLSCIALVAIASLSPDMQTALTARLTQWSPIKVDAFNALVTQMAAEWQLSHRFWLLFLSASSAGALWLKLVGAIQQTLRITGQRDGWVAISLSQRLNTLLLAGIGAMLLGLSYGIVFVALPEGVQTAVAEATVWNFGKRLILEGLRWSLAFSTIALLFGLLYRASLRFPARSQPLLPGAIMATGLWIVLSIALKVHVSALPNHHWLYGVLSTTVIVLAGLYISLVGLLMGGCFNLLLSYYLPQPKARSQFLGTPPAPSFDSFTIERRTNRRP
ncbi:MAG: YhjD/YihY/BrkB family envelope integrity protein [Cyanobacteria bacterium J06626_18]